MMITKILLIVNLANFICPFNTISAATNFSKHDMHNEFQTLSLQLRMDNLLEKLEVTLKNVEERANTWAIFKHNIDAWNEQIKVIDHKLNLIKQSQEDQQHKLTALEFTQNHVLSKVVFLSESCVTKVNNNGYPDGIERTDRTQDELHNLNKRKLNEIIEQLSTLLHHINNGNARKSGANKQSKANVIAVGCNGTSSTNRIQQLEVFLKQFQRKFIAFADTQPTKKEFHQIQEMAKKNSKILEQISSKLQEVNDMHGANDSNWDRLYAHCSSVKSELTTFTTSSDLLLKMLENLIKSLHKDLKNISNVTDIEKTVQSTIRNTVTDDEDEDNYEVDLDYASINNTENIDQSNGDDIEHNIDFKSDKKGCHELQARVDGIYNFGDVNLNKASRDFNERFCKFATTGPAWTLIQYRNSFFEWENFNRSWYSYSVGFGSINLDFWFGNEYIHQLTHTEPYELRIELEDFDDEHGWAEYSNFSLSNELGNYKLSIGGYRGVIGDALAYHNLKEFSTYDRRNDHNTEPCSCAVSYGSGWWFDKCFESNLNGIYRDTPLDHANVGIIWKQWRGDYSLKSAKMLIRPRQNRK